jgi:hypothetical protein
MKQVTRCTLFIVPMLIAIALISSCSPNKSNNTSLPYAERNVGDIKQLVYMYDSATILVKVIGETQRPDGQKVFTVEWTDGTELSRDTFYEFVRNGYLISSDKDTLLDTSPSYIPGNPYIEQYIAKAYPTIGDKWIHTPHSENDTNMFWIAKYNGDLTTYAGTFNNVFGFDLYDLSIDDTVPTCYLTVYYAPGMDWVASIIAGNDTVLCSYSNIGGKEQGHLWPAKDFGTTTLEKHLYKTKFNRMKKMLMNGMLF